jgi:alkaline phosphatase D
MQAFFSRVCYPKGQEILTVKLFACPRAGVKLRVLIPITALVLGACSQSPKKVPLSDIAAPAKSTKPTARTATKSKDQGRRIASLTPAKKYVPENQNKSAFAPRGIDYEATLTDIGFGSWANQNLPQPIWSAVQGSKPSLFVFLGDTVKLEDRSMAEQYAVLNSIPEYRSLRESTPFLAMWNTQDFKAGTGQREFLQQWTYLRDAVNVGQTGIYHSKVIGPRKKQVQFILLDTRTFRGPRLADDKPNAPVLGEEQWQWLEQQLARPAEIKFLISSIPFIPARKDGESWNNYPVERQRLVDLIKKTKTKNLVVFSGGARQGSISKTGLKDWGLLYDITTGPLNDPSEQPPEPDDRFDGPTSISENFAMAQIDWSLRLLTLKLLDAHRAVLHSVSLKIH